MQGYAVTAVQQALERAGIRPTDPTGIFDASTEKEVVLFQERNSLKPDGIVGEKTLTALGPYLEVLLSLGDDASQVRTGTPWTGLAVEQAKEYF
jgi:peptidoglycan hydrolase-like protein with peptidoglycan-binding domain